jgi:transposase-like protein
MMKATLIQARMLVNKPHSSQGVATMKIRLTLPIVKTGDPERPTSCCYCEHWRLHRHGTVSKPLTDHRQQHVSVQRYRCCACGRTFRHYPPGVTRHTQSQHTIVLAALLYGFGLSCSASAHILTALEVPLSRMSVWRDAQLVGAKLRHNRPTGLVPVLGVDETSVKVKGREVIVGMATDAQRERTVEWTLLTGTDAETIQAWLEPLVSAYGVEVLVTDEHASYGVVTDELALDHQLCLAHVRKALTRRARSIREQAEASWGAQSEMLQLVTRQLARMTDLVRDLPATGAEELEQLHYQYVQAPKPGPGEQASVAYRMRMLTLDLWDNWNRLGLYLKRPDLGLDGTNNVTERAIGKSKVRYKTMRGYTSLGGLANGLALTQWLYSGAAVHDLGAVLTA